MRARRSSSTVVKRRTHNRFSFSVRMNRSAQPLPSGSRTKAGELSMPRKRISAWKWWLTYWLPWSWRSRGPGGAPFAKRPKRPRPAPLGERAEALAHRLLDRLERLKTIGATTGMDTDAFGRAVVNGDEDGSLALAGHHRGQIAAPHRIDPI